MKRFPDLNLPHCDLRLIYEDDVLKVWDSLRKKIVKLTPEEIVRQHFVAWLTNYLHFPPSVMANEKEIELNNTKRRCDTIVFRPDGSPLVIIEYKSPLIEITQDVFDQIVRYNMVLKAGYLIVSNGLKHYCCRINYSDGSYQFIPRIPDYREIAHPFSVN